jgi:hypothetical protein
MGKLIAVLAGLAVLGAAGAVLLSPARRLPSKITPENCARIHTGLTRAEVEAILGPPGDTTTMEPVGSFPYRMENLETTSVETLPADLVFRRAVWAVDGLKQQVGFSSDGKVTWTATILWKCDERAWFTNLLYRAKRQWRRWFPD